MSFRLGSSRFEIKYQINNSTRETLFRQISPMLIPDVYHKDEGGYGNYSIYFDAPGQRYRIEKEEGLELRTKPRLRIYKRLRDFSSIGYFFELKHRIDSNIEKERVAIDLQKSQTLLDPFNFSFAGGGSESPVLTKFSYLVRRYNLRPVLCVLYKRRAFTSKYFSGLRVTFDSRVSGCPVPRLDNPPSSFKSIIPPHHSIIEIKYNDRLPNWISKVCNKLEMQRISISKFASAAQVLGN